MLSLSKPLAFTDVINGTCFEARNLSDITTDSVVNIPYSPIYSNVCLDYAPILDDLGLRNYRRLSYEQVGTGE
jgi:hypothetical protein